MRTSGSPSKNIKDGKMFYIILPSKIIWNKQKRQGPTKKKNNVKLPGYMQIMRIVSRCIFIRCFHFFSSGLLHVRSWPMRCTIFLCSYFLLIITYTTNINLSITRKTTNVYFLLSSNISSAFIQFHDLRDNISKLRRNTCRDQRRERSTSDGNPLFPDSDSPLFWPLRPFSLPPLVLWWIEHP